MIRFIKHEFKSISLALLLLILFYGLGTVSSIETQAFPHEIYKNEIIIIRIMFFGIIFLTVGIVLYLSWLYEKELFDKNKDSWLVEISAWQIISVKMVSAICVCMVCSKLMYLMIDQINESWHLMQEAAIKIGVKNETTFFQADLILEENFFYIGSVLLMFIWKGYFCQTLTYVLNNRNSKNSRVAMFIILFLILSIGEVIILQLIGKNSFNIGVIISVYFVIIMIFLNKWFKII